VASIAGPKNPAFGPSAKYSSQAEESTTFKLDPCREVPSCRFLSRSHAIERSDRTGMNSRDRGIAALHLLPRLQPKGLADSQWDDNLELRDSAAIPRSRRVHFLSDRYARCVASERNRPRPVTSRHRIEFEVVDSSAWLSTSRMDRTQDSSGRRSRPTDELVVSVDLPARSVQTGMPGNVVKAPPATVAFDAAKGGIV